MSGEVVGSGVGGGGARFVDDGHCFACGLENDQGLQLRFMPFEGGGAVCEHAVPERFRSWVGIIHGGVVGTILDEAMAWAAVYAGTPAVTARLEVRLRLPLEVGERFRAFGRIESQRHSLLMASAHLERVVDGRRVAEATGSLMMVPAEIR